MKAISLWQPWATLIAIGAKRIETRSWHTSHRGPLAIHATLKADTENLGVCNQEPFRTALAGAGMRVVGDLPLGYVVAVCTLTDCLTINYKGMMVGEGIYEPPPPEPESSFGNYSPGRYAWLLADIQPLLRPLPWKGKQQFFDVPDDAIAAAMQPTPPAPTPAPPAPPPTPKQMNLFQHSEGMRW